MKILVMRPLPEGKELVNNLNNIGISSWHFSLFDFYPIFSSINLSNKIKKLYESDTILIFSKKSVYYTNLYFRYHNLTWPIYPRYFTIGKSTALYLSRYIKKNFFSSKIRK